MFQLFGDEDDAELSKTGPSEAEMIKQRTAAATADLVQGGSLRTWSYRSPAVEQVQVVLSTEGRPLDAGD